MKEITRTNRAYQRWCEQTFPDYKRKDYPYRGRMYEVWCAAWVAAKQDKQTKGESK